MAKGAGKAQLKRISSWSGLSDSLMDFNFGVRSSSEHT